MEECPGCGAFYSNSCDYCGFNLCNSFEHKTITAAIVPKVYNARQIDKINDWGFLVCIWATATCFGIFIIVLNAWKG